MGSINCYQCSGTDSNAPFECNEYLESDTTLVPNDCEGIHDAQYCIKHVGRFEGTWLFKIKIIFGGWITKSFLFSYYLTNKLTIDVITNSRQTVDAVLIPNLRKITWFISPSSYNFWVLTLANKIILTILFFC